MTLQFTVNLKQHPTVRTFIRSTVAVYTTFVCLQVAGVTETVQAEFLENNTTATASGVNNVAGKIHFTHEEKISIKV